MQYLKAIVAGDKIYTFVFDRHSGLLKSIPSVFPDSPYCYSHLKFNLTAVISSKYRRRLFILKKFKNLFMHQPTRSSRHSGKNLSNSKPASEQFLSRCASWTLGECLLLWSKIWLCILYSSCEFQLLDPWRM